MLRKLASPRNKRQHTAPNVDSIQLPDKTTPGKSLEAAEKSLTPRKKGTKLKLPKERNNLKVSDEVKKNLGEITPARELPSQEAKNVGTEKEVLSPRQLISHAFKKKKLPDQDEKKTATKKKQPVSPKKKKSKKQLKAEKRQTLVSNRPEIPSPDKPSIDPIITAKDKTIHERPNTAPDLQDEDKKIYIQKTIEASNQPNEHPIFDQEDADPPKPFVSSISDHNTTSRSSRHRDRDLQHPPQLELSSGDNNPANHTNVLSPLRRYKRESEDTSSVLPASSHTVHHLHEQFAPFKTPPAFQPEVHLIGEIVSGHGFRTTGALTCKWRAEYGNRWILIAGETSGQTQLDDPSTAPWTAEPDVAVWSHPIDLHFATSTFQGWPKLLFQVWRADASLKLHVLGYGFVPIPFAAGQHNLWVSLWRPLGTIQEELDVRILGRTQELKDDDVLFSSAWSERCRLRTVSTGKVLIHIGVLLRHFEAGGIQV